MEIDKTQIQQLVGLARQILEMGLILCVLS